MRSRVIGGEMELHRVPDVKPVLGDYYCYASGRAALYQILANIKLTTEKVWLPDWLCETMIDAVKRTGLDYGFYALGDGLRMDVQRFLERNNSVDERDAIVLVNYFGLTDVEQTIRELRAVGTRSIIIEDDVQALFSFFDDKTSADYRFTSLRKSIASPDGGLVKTNAKMPVVCSDNSFSKLKLQGAMLKGNGGEDAEYLRLFEAGEVAMDANYDSKMSEVAGKILAGTNLEETARTRRCNAEYVVDELQKLGITPLAPLDERSVPLFVPITIGDRDEVRRALRQKAIFCPVHWPLRKDMMCLDNGRQMAEKELSLVIDQRYGLDDMSAMIETIKGQLCK